MTTQEVSSAFEIIDKRFEKYVKIRGGTPEHTRAIIKMGALLEIKQDMINSYKSKL